MSASSSKHIVHPPPSSSLASTLARLQASQWGVDPSSVPADQLDDRVAALILKEAKEKEKRYKEKDGVGAYVDAVPDADDGKRPQPTNKRFLKSMIRDVNGHNELLRRQEEEAAAHRNSPLPSSHYDSRASSHHDSRPSSRNESRPVSRHDAHSSSRDDLNPSHRRNPDSHSSRRDPHLPSRNGSDRDRTRPVDPERLLLRMTTSGTFGKERREREADEVEVDEEEEMRRMRATRRYGNRDERERRVVKGISSGRDRGSGGGARLLASALGGAALNARKDPSRQPSTARLNGSATTALRKERSPRSETLRVKSRSRSRSPPPRFRSRSPPRPRRRSPSESSQPRSRQRSCSRSPKPRSRRRSRSRSPPPRSRRRSHSRSPSCRPRERDLHPTETSLHPTELPLRPTETSLHPTGLPPAHSSKPPAPPERQYSTKMDKYFSASYDPRLDIDITSLTDKKTGYVADGGFDEWDSVLRRVKEGREERKAEKERERREKEERRERRREKREKKRRRKEGDSSESDGEERGRRRRRKRSVSDSEGSIGPKPRRDKDDASDEEGMYAPGKLTNAQREARKELGLMDVEGYARKGKVREWDLGK